MRQGSLVHGPALWLNGLTGHKSLQRKKRRVVLRPLRAGLHTAPCFRDQGTIGPGNHRPGPAPVGPPALWRLRDPQCWRLLLRCISARLGTFFSQSRTAVLKRSALSGLERSHSKHLSLKSTSTSQPTNPPKETRGR